MVTRKKFINLLALLPFSGGFAMNWNELTALTQYFEETPPMPVLFVGHGSPMNAIEDNLFSREMKEVGKKLPKPNAILMISAHWETAGTFVTAQEKPPTIHDFGGFPQALFDVQYPAPGSKWLAEDVKKIVSKTEVQLNEEWGFDHGCWSVTKNMFPNADVPIIQLSLDYRKDASYHYELAQQLSLLRRKGILIIGSGNMVHNFQYLQLKEAGDFNKPFAHDWAIEANDLLKKKIIDNDYKALTHYSSLGKPINLAVPTPEHYLPMLYALASRQNKDELFFFNDITIAGSFAMTSFILKSA